MITFINRKQLVSICYVVIFILVLVVGYLGLLSLRKELPMSMEEKEKQEIVEGLIKSIGGKIVSVDQGKRQVVITLNEFLDTEHYTIETTEDTVFSIAEFQKPNTNSNINNSSFGQALEVDKLVKGPALKSKGREVSFEALRKGLQIEVRFSQRLIPNTAVSLIAKEVIIIK